MTLREIADVCGIETYPEELEAVYASLAQDDKPACDLELIDRLQEEYNAFEEFYDLVREIAIQINSDPYRSAWVKTTYMFEKDKNVADARKVPVPKPDGTQITAMLPLYTLIPQIPDGIENYRRRGFGEETATSVAKLGGTIRIVKSHTGMPGINWLYHYWRILFLKAAIFYTEGLQFELRKLPDAAIYLKNKQDGSFMMIATKGKFHRSGEQVLGSAGYEDAEGAFSAEYAEDDENFYGHAIVNSVVDPERKAYSKAEWDSFARPGQDCISLHIPHGANITPEAMEKAVKSAREIVARSYPEHGGTVVFGSSWILDPKLAELLGPNSKITKLLEMFWKYPQKCNGTSIFGYVFPKNYESIETLPEDTSLQRKIKQLYLDGGYIHTFAGVIL